MVDFNKETYQIQLEYIQNCEQPSQVFLAMSKLIDAFKSLDKLLIDSLVVDIESSIILKGIEVGSIKAILCTVLKAIDDDAIKDLDWKKLIGHYLLKAKYTILRHLEDNNEFTNIEQVNKLCESIYFLAAETDIKNTPIYIAPTPRNLLSGILNVYSSIETLSPEEKVIYSSQYGEVKINRFFNISEQVVEELITKETMKSTTEMILRIKKPDYLGYSMWDVSYNNKIIQVKIMDFEWLHKFQNRKIDIQPGDSILANVETINYYGYDYSLINEHHTVIKVLDVIKNNYYPQQEIFNESN